MFQCQTAEKSYFYPVLRANSTQFQGGTRSVARHLTSLRVSKLSDCRVSLACLRLQSHEMGVETSDGFLTFSKLNKSCERVGVAIGRGGCY